MKSGKISIKMLDATVEITLGINITPKSGKAVRENDANEAELCFKTLHHLHEEYQKAGDKSEIEESKNN